jgi:hypothetical protein
MFWNRLLFTTPNTGLLTGQPTLDYEAQNRPEPASTLNAIVQSKIKQATEQIVLF